MHFKRKLISKRVLNSLATSYLSRSTQHHSRTSTTCSTFYIWHNIARVVRSTWLWPLSVYSTSTLAVRSRSVPIKSALLTPSSSSTPYAQISTSNTNIFINLSAGGSMRPRMMLARCNSSRYTCRWRSRSTGSLWKQQVHKKLFTNAPIATIIIKEIVWDLKYIKVNMHANMMAWFIECADDLKDLQIDWVQDHYHITIKNPLHFSLELDYLWVGLSLC